MYLNRYFVLKEEQHKESNLSIDGACPYTQAPAGFQHLNGLGLQRNAGSSFYIHLADSPLSKNNADQKNSLVVERSDSEQSS